MPDCTSQPVQAATRVPLPLADTAARSASRHALPIVLALLVALAAYYLLPGPWLCLPALAAFAVLAWRRLDLTLGVLPVTFPFWYVPKTVYGHIVVPLSEIAIALCALVAGAQCILLLLQQRHALRPAFAYLAQAPLGTACAALQTQITSIGLPVLLGAGLFALGTGIGIVVAVRPHEALRAFRWEVAEPLLYAALLLTFARSRVAIRVLVWSLLGSGALVAGLAVLQVLWLHVTFTPLASGNRLVAYVNAQGSVPRATGIIYGSPNSLGAWMERILPVALALALLRLSEAPVYTSRAARLLRVLPRAGAWLVVVLCTAALWESTSRGALVGAAAGTALVVGAFVMAQKPKHTAAESTGGVLSFRAPRLRRRRRPILLASASSLLLLIALVAWNGDTLLTALLQSHHGSGEMRLLLWLAALHMLRDHPLLGIGPDQFLYHYSSLYTSHPYWITFLNGQKTIAWREPTLSHPHNLLLDLWLSGGLCALVGFALTALGYTKIALEVIRCGTPWQAAVALGLLGGVVASLVHGMVDSAYFVPDLALVFWTAVAVLVMLRQNPASDHLK